MAGPSIRVFHRSTLLPRDVRVPLPVVALEQVRHLQAHRRDDVLDGAPGEAIQQYLAIIGRHSDPATPRV
jgi:hypothetical protein